MADDGRDALMLSNQLCFAVYSAAHALNRAYRPLLDGLGLTYPQYLVMLALWEEDGRTVSGLGDALRLDSGTLTPLLKRLEAAGLVTRRRSPADERHVVISLTATGARLREKARDIPAALACVMGGDLALIEHLRTALTDLRDTIEANRAADAGAGIAGP